MPQTYLCRFSPVAVPLAEVVARIEPFLAKAGATFDGTVRNFEPGPDSGYYYSLESFDAESLRGGAAKALRQPWKGVALECTLEGSDVTIGIYDNSAAAFLVIDQEGRLQAKQQADRDAYGAWLALLLATACSLGAQVCVWQRGGVKAAADSNEVRDAFREGRVKPYSESWILTLLRYDVMTYDEIAALDLKGFRVTTTTAGYTIVTWLHARD